MDLLSVVLFRTIRGAFRAGRHDPRTDSGIQFVGSGREFVAWRLLLPLFDLRDYRGIIAVDQFNKTNVPGIYAIGDVSGPPMLAHKAEHEGVVCIEAIKGLHPHPMNSL
jgi:pyruvate/2-oxoglutarate dehydrogenase complex dihydrolipoamide dehydrogenase (E3) component